MGKRNGFVMFGQFLRQRLRKKGVVLAPGFAAIRGIVAAHWRQLSEEEKQKWKDRAKQERQALAALRKRQDGHKRRPKRLLQARTQLAASHKSPRHINSKTSPPQPLRPALDLLTLSMLELSL